MLGISIWTFYSLSLWWFFITTLDNEEKIAIWERVLSIFPPLASSMATVGYFYYFRDVELSRWFIPFWCLSFLCAAYETWDAKKLGGEFSPAFAIGFAVVTITICFGPGLFLGYAWIAKW